MNTTTTTSSSVKKKMKNKIRFSDEQIRCLETMFDSETKIEPKKKIQVARELGLHPRQIAIWFQNKRARWKSKLLERDYSILKANYNNLASRFEVLKKENQSLIVQLVSCGSVSLESSYERVAQCVYTSTLLYEFGEPGLKPSDVKNSCFNWRLTYAERFSTDFYITDSKSGIRALVKAGPDCKVNALIIERKLVKTTQNGRVLSSHLRKWLRDRNLPAEARVLRLEEGYIKEGSSVSVLGLLHRNNDVVMIVQPQDVISTGCLWQKLLLPVDVDGLVIGFPEGADPLTLTNSTPCQE